MFGSLMFSKIEIIPGDGILMFQTILTVAILLSYSNVYLVA